MWSYKKIGLSHEMGLIDTPPLIINVRGTANILDPLNVFITPLVKFSDYTLRGENSASHIYHSFKLGQT